MESSPGSARKVLLIGWDAADWKVIWPLIEAGKMPTLERLISGGAWGQLATLRPILSPMLWSSIATGKRPYLHGVHGFTEPDPDTGRVRPVSSLSRQVKAVWNILSQSGLKSNVVGWWPSHPAEPINGVMVSNHYQRAVAPADQPWPMASGTVHPARLAQPLRALRVHPALLEAEHLLPFVPQAAKIDQQTDKRLESLARIIADCASIHAAATAILQLEPWDFMAVYYDAIDHFCHGFMKYHPPRQPHVSEADFELYQGVVEAAYRYHDMMLGALLRLAGPDATVILLSDHGFHSDHLRPAQLPLEPAGPAAEHNPFGILAMRGPGIRSGEVIYGASLLDITPTILTLLDLPVGQDMQGKPLREALDDPPEPKTVESWETIPGECGMHPADLRIDPVEARESLQQLIDLGYIEDPGENAEQAVQETVREQKYNLAQAYVDDHRFAEARDLLEDLRLNWPDELRFANLLMVCYRSLHQVDQMAAVVEDILQTRVRLAETARESIAELRQHLLEERERRGLDQAGDAALDAALHEPGSARNASGDSASKTEPPATRQKDEAEGPILSPQQQRDLQKWRRQANPGKLVEPYLRGLVALEQGDKERALQLLGDVAASASQSVELQLTLGEAFLELKRYAEAEQAFRGARDVDPNLPRALFGLGRCALVRRQNYQAAEYFLEAVGLCHFFPAAHFQLGVALHRLGRLAEAVDAILLSLQQNPGSATAHERLAYIYEKRLHDVALASQHRIQVRSLRQLDRDREWRLANTPPQVVAPRAAATVSGPWPVKTRWPDESPDDVAAKRRITIVSGLPRSGTSMMMQMLAAGGIEPLTDQQRAADADNPRGYYEYEPVKRIATENSWLPEAQGKVLKVIAQSLPHLPGRFRYRVVFMRRSLEEVIRSQRTMLDRNARAGAALDESRLTATLMRQLVRVTRWLEAAEAPCLVESYQEVIDHPAATAERLGKFLEIPLDEAAMAAAVEAPLYRQRS